jgi:hypothetical protein
MVGMKFVGPSRERLPVYPKRRVRSRKQSASCLCLTQLSRFERDKTAKQRSTAADDAPGWIITPRAFYDRRWTASQGRVRAGGPP